MSSENFIIPNKQNTEFKANNTLIQERNEQQNNIHPLQLDEIQNHQSTWEYKANKTEINWSGFSS